MAASGGADVMIVWWVLTLATWVLIPGAVVYVVWRFLRAYEARTAAIARVEALELRLARLETQAGAPERPQASASRGT